MTTATLRNNDRTYFIAIQAIALATTLALTVLTAVELLA